MLTVGSYLWAGVGQIFPKRLNRALLVELDEFGDGGVFSRVPGDDELSRFALAYYEVATAPVASVTKRKARGVSASPSMPPGCMHSVPWAQHDSLVGEDVAGGLVTETDQEAAQLFLMKNLLCIPVNRYQLTLWRIKNNRLYNEGYIY